MTLPIVLVTAADTVAAESVISDLLEGETIYPHKDGQVIWELHNKYYTCKVMVTSSRDDFPSQPVEAHLVYLKPGEDEAVAQARIGNVVADIKLVATRSAPSDAIRQWCVESHYELVSLDPIPDEEGDEDDAADGHGAARLRAALHAHTWPNLRRHTHSDAEAEFGSELAVEQLSEMLSMVEEFSVRARRSTDDAQRRRIATAGLLALLRAAGDDLDSDLDDDLDDLDDQHDQPDHGDTAA